MSASAANAPNSLGPEKTSTRRARLLVVEDEWLISSLISDELTDLGFEVVGPASTIGEAVSLASAGGFDAALVDLSLGGILANDVIAILLQRRIPFIFVTGYSSVPEGIEASALLLEKPFSAADLLAAIATVLPGR